jgi:hypothetical protein
MAFPGLSYTMRQWRFHDQNLRRDIPAMEVLDFVRALNERPAWLKLLFRLVVGKYAYTEFLFVVKNMRDSGYDPLAEYGCQDHDYHTYERPWLWWKRADAASSESKEPK